MSKKEKKAVEIMQSQPSMEFPWHVGRFFGSNSRKIDFAGDQASFGEDYGTLGELRPALEWFVKQFGGTVKWSKEKL